MSAFTILDRVGSDPKLDPGFWDAPDSTDGLGDDGRMGEVMRRGADRIGKWCDEWRFEGDRSGEWDDEEKRREGRRGKVPGWDEVADKAEELIWVAVAMYASTTRPGYERVQLDPELSKAALACLLLPTLLEVVSSGMRPYILQAVWRALVATWLARGRPRLYIADSLMSATACPTPPGAPLLDVTGLANALAHLPPPSQPALSPLDQTNHIFANTPESPLTPTGDSNGRLRVNGTAGTGGASDSDDDDCGSAWPGVLGAVIGHEDGEVVGMVRALALVGQKCGWAEVGVYKCGMRGTELLDGSVFVRAAGLTLSAVGWGRNKEHGRAKFGWTTAPLGLDSTWTGMPTRAGFEAVGSPRSGSTTPQTPLSPGGGGAPRNGNYFPSPNLAHSQAKGKGRAPAFDLAQARTRTLSPPPMQYTSRSRSQAFDRSSSEDVHTFSPNSSATSPSLAAPASSSRERLVGSRAGSPAGNSRMVSSPDLGQTTIFFAEPSGGGHGDGGRAGGAGKGEGDRGARSFGQASAHAREESEERDEQGYLVDHRESGEEGFGGVGGGGWVEDEDEYELMA